MKIVAIIQARMGSTRLPGKVMLPLGCRFVLQHVVKRVRHAERVDQTIVATSNKSRDDIIARFTPRFGVNVYRGSETDVLERMFQAARIHDADTVVRVTADCPLIDPEVVDVAIRRRKKAGVDYCSNIQKRTFPRGLDIEAFTFDSFARLKDQAMETHHREHVTPFYRENPDRYKLESVTSDMIYDEPTFRNRTDLRLTLDEASDYDLLNRIYTEVSYEEVLPVKDAIRYVDENGLETLNKDIERKSVEDNGLYDSG